jgi:NADH:ubiquinone oxidoreductase subunit 4 (subunit M)
LKQIVITLSTGVLCLSCASVNSLGRDGMLGAWLLVLSQSLATSIGILLSGVLERCLQTRDITQINGLLFRCPTLAVVLSVILASLAGLPVLPVFAGAYMVFCAASETSTSLLIGEIVGMAFLVRSTLRVYRLALLGNRDTDRQVHGLPSNTPDLSFSERITLVALVSLLIAINLAPSLLLDQCEPAVRRLNRGVQRVSQTESSSAPRELVRQQSPSNDQ